MVYGEDVILGVDFGRYSFMINTMLEQLGELEAVTYPIFKCLWELSKQQR